MARYQFVQRPRPRNTNQPTTYDILSQAAGAMCANSVGTLTKRKNNWDLQWLGTSTRFDTKAQIARHMSMLGHTTTGLI